MHLCLFILELHALDKTRYCVLICFESFLFDIFDIFQAFQCLCSEIQRKTSQLVLLCSCWRLLFVCCVFCLLCNAALCMEELSERPSRDLRGTRRPRSPLADGRRLLVLGFLNIKYKWFIFWEGLLCRDPRILTENDWVVILRYETTLGRISG